MTDLPKELEAEAERAKVQELDHPCKQTCSGWKQGYERGLAAAQEAIAAIQKKE